MELLSRADVTACELCCAAMMMQGEHHLRVLVQQPMQESMCMHRWTRSMFDRALPHVERAIEQCHFYAFDLEMTGLHVSDQRESWVDDMEDRYRVVGPCPWLG